MRRTLTPRNQIFMSKMGKRLKSAKSAINKAQVYKIGEAIKLLKAATAVKFDATVEVHAKLGIDPKKGDQIVRASAVLPHGSGQKVKVAAIVPNERVKEAQAAGADIAGSDELIEEIKKTGKCDFDIVVTVPAMIKSLASVARILGQKGLMPNPKTDTIGEDLNKMIGELKKGKVSYKNDDTGNVHSVLGKISFSDQALQENFNTWLESLKKAKPAGVKGSYIRSLSVNSSMGPSVKVSPN